MGNQEKSSKRRYCNGNFYASFQGRVVEDTEGKRRIFTFVNTCCVLSTILGRTPTMEEYKAAVKN
jgi:aconitate hydratase 2/2-methylisocitrate dehydratase